MIKRTTIAMSALAVLAFTALASCLSTIESALGSAGSGQKVSAVSNAEAVSALRDALKEGIQSASRQLAVKDGYFGNALLKILLPPEAKPMLDSVGKIPQGQKLIYDVVLRLNRSAEEAAKDVVPIFVDAIQAMTIQDSIAIVKGNDR